ncbi:hypothetical protein [Halosimplex salinum]|uniref:hypothetical protein n=1 Tax=Halosimplex salinum TaxID=1710538 RepID=UPI000F475786|nr:hypothetical protein [Halosimplex salinum]
MRRNFKGTDRGKRVISGDGSAVGTLVRVDGDRAHVLLDPERAEHRDVGPTDAGASRSTLTIDRRTVAESTNERIELTDDADLLERRRHA